MTVLTRELRASYAFVERNFYLTKRYWGWEVAWFVYALTSALTVTRIGADQNDKRLLVSLLIGAVFWYYLSIVFGFIAETVAWERWAGTPEFTFMAPVRRYPHLVGSTAYAIVYGLIHTGLVIVALVFFFGLDISQANFGTAIVFTIVGSFSIVGIGMMAAILPLLYVERGAQMTFVLQSILLLFSGVYYSISILPQWMQTISAFSPGTYILNGVRAGLMDGVPVTDLIGQLVPLVMSNTVLIPLGIFVFGKAEQYAKRTGKLKRVG